MSAGVLEGNGGYPERFSPDAGVVEFVPTREPSLDVRRAWVTSETLRRTVPASQAMIFLAQNLAE